jgi:tetratricopeptide (TPR) repeat protein
MGAVYRAHDPVFDREVAIKVMHAGCDAERFVIESKVTARLPHPGVPPVYALGTLADGRPFLAMKLVEGRTLADELAAPDRPDLPRLLNSFEQICQTVGFAHAKGIIHRDLKPANVMVGRFGEVLVMDWGLAREARGVERGTRSEESDPTAEPSAVPRSALHTPRLEETRAGAVKGTPAYMAPEQARGEAVDARADVFALGGILAAILTGAPPFRGDTVHDTVLRAARAELTDSFARLDACGADSELIALAKKCLAPQPADRYPDGRAVAEAVGAYRAGVEDRLRRAERDRAVSAAEAREQRKRRKVQLALGAALGLLLAAGGAFAWYSDRQTEAQKRKQIEADAEVNARLERNRATTTALIEQTEVALRGWDADRADATLAQVWKWIDEGGLDDLLPRVERCVADLAVLRELDEIDNARWTFAHERLPTWKELAPLFVKAFAGYGIVPGSTPPNAAAKRINESLVREPLLAHLEIWAATGDRPPAVREILTAADPDPFRDAVRADNYARVALVRGFRGEPVPAPTIWFAIGQGQDTRLPVPAREQILLAALRDRPNAFPLLVSLAALGEVTGKDGYTRRAGWCRAALAVRPRNVVMWTNLGVALKELGDLKGAVGAYEKAIELAPNSAPAYNNLGNVRRIQRDYAGALIQFDRALARNPDYAIALVNRGAVLLDLKRFAEALPLFARAIKIEPDYAAAHYNTGMARNALGDPNGAIAAYSRAIERDPNYLAAYNARGVAQRAAGRPDEAERDYREGMRRGDESARVRTNLSGIYLDRKNYAGAIEWARAALARDPKYAEAYVMLGSAHFWRGELVSAREALTEAARLDPQYDRLVKVLPRPPGAPWPREVRRLRIPVLDE